MSPHQSLPGVERALAYIHTQLEKGAWHRGARLPSTKELAVRAGVGVRTMIKACATLKAAGFLFGVRGGNLRAGSGAAGGVWESYSRGAARGKREALEKDILSGLYAVEGRLPSMKELQSRYGTCYRTMRSILEGLKEGGIVRLENRRYRLKGTEPQHASQHVIFITHAFALPPRSALNPEEYRVIDTLERECMRRALKLDIIEIDFNDPGAVRAALSGAALTDATLGVVLDVWWFADQEFRLSYLDLLAGLARVKRPVALLDELGDFVLPLQFSANPLLQVFRFEGRSAGTQIGRLLLNLGHRSAAFISGAPTADWSQQRYAGIRASFAAVGLAANVRDFTTAAPYGDEQILTLSNFDRVTLQKAAALGRTKRQRDEMLAQIDRNKCKHPELEFSPEDIAQLRGILAPLSDTAHGSSDESGMRTIQNAVMRKANSQLGKMLETPLFEQALEWREATVWICSSDILALTALRYLRDRGVKVPKDLSLASFDNIPMESLEYRLTTFDFNAAGFMYRMLEFLLRPPKPREVYRHAPIEIEGMIVERATTARVHSTPVP